jgi:hypothetical protein
MHAELVHGNPPEAGGGKLSRAVKTFFSLSQ